jgi:hypothetical protein
MRNRYPVWPWILADRFRDRDDVEGLSGWKFLGSVENHTWPFLRAALAITDIRQDDLAAKETAHPTTPASESKILIVFVVKPLVARWEATRQRLEAVVARGTTNQLFSALRNRGAGLGTGVRDHVRDRHTDEQLADGTDDVRAKPNDGRQWSLFDGRGLTHDRMFANEIHWHFVLPV